MSATPSPQNRMAPTYAEGHIRNIHRCTIFARPTPLGVSQDLPPWAFRNTPPGVVSDAPWVQNTPRGVCKHPRGWFRKPLRVRTTPGCA